VTVPEFPRFYDWQLTQSAEDSWAECRLHAEKIRRIHEIGRTQSGTGVPPVKESGAGLLPPKRHGSKNGVAGIMPEDDLFGGRE
jgi:hypothetical protein